MLVVDAINERAAAFYEGNGFVRLPDSLRLVLPMHAIQRLVEPRVARGSRRSWKSTRSMQTPCP
jgi:hypothetical protein